MTDLFDAHDDDGTLEALGRALPRVSPPEDMLDRVLAAAQPVTAPSTGPLATGPLATGPLATGPLATGRHPKTRWRSRWLPIAAAAAAAAVIAAGITIRLEQGTGPGSVAAVAAISSQPGSRLTGLAKLYRPGQPGGEIRLSLRHVPPPPSGTHYELWLLPQGTSAMTATASFTPAGNDVDLLLPLPGPDSYKAFEISVQPDHGSPERSRRSLASGTFASPD